MNASGMNRRARRTSILLGAALAALAAVTATPATGQEAAPRVAPGAAVQVTANPMPVRAHSSPQIARNPANGELVLVESDVRGARTCAVHISGDGGRTWSPGGDPMLKPFNDCGFYGEYGPYATLTFAKNNELYLAFVASEFLGRARNETPRSVFLARSDDGGRSFATTKVFDAPDGNPDRGLNKGPMLAVDPSAPQRVYVGWRQGIFAPNAKEKLKSNVAASTDGGRTFGPPVDLTDENGGDYPGLAVGPDGVVHAVFWTRAFPPAPAGAPPGRPRPIQYSRSTDRGRTWSKGTAIDPGNQSAARPPLLAADPNSTSVYMVWYATAEADNQAPGFLGFQDIFLRTSADGGRTWGDRVTVNDDRAKVNHYEPGVSIAPNGRLDIAWYDFRNNPVPAVPTTGQGTEEGMSDVYYTSSSDRGRTMRPNLRITDRAIDRSLGVWKFASKFNVGITSTNDTVNFAWQDTRNAIRDTSAEDVYATSLALTGRTDASGSSGRGVPGWLLVGAGVAVGMGLTMVTVWLVRRPVPPG